MFVVLAVPLSADEGWVVNRLDIQYTVRSNGAVEALESVDVDFRGLSRHGIFRDITRRQQFDETYDRTYGVDLVGVVDGRNLRQDVEVLEDGANRRFKIGNASRTISGPESYRIGYRLTSVLNAFADHDEFYWNTTGTWPVPIEHTVVRVRVPQAGVTRVECFQGFTGSTERCDSRMTGDEATFAATRALAPGEQLTIVTFLRKGVVSEPKPALALRPRDPLHYFDRTPLWAGLSMGGAGGAIVLVLSLWWRVGRDRRYIGLQRLATDTREERVPLFGGRPLAVEFQPPDQIRPAQIGLLLDESADTLDVTATIVDLAVRGYVRITEIEKEHWFGKKDWQLDRLAPAAGDAALLEYERIVLGGLFEAGSPTKVSALKNKFYDDLAKAKSALYKDAVARGWFPANPSTVRLLWTLGGVATAIGGIVLTVTLGKWFGAGLVGLPVIGLGALVVMFAKAMPRRTAAGQDVLRRTLGFMRYIRTAETEQQAFAERANLFTEYLPYAVVFQCVALWARAFKNLDLQAATSGFYAGSSGFNASSFSSSVSGFSSSISSSMSSTPGGSGSSGSGGSSGGGGGGGGGGSW